MKEMADPPSEEARPLAWRVSLWLGMLGAVLIAAGFVADVEALVLSGVAAGTLSLVSVLIWRSQLIDAWRRSRDGQSS